MCLVYPCRRNYIGVLGSAYFANLQSRSSLVNFMFCCPFLGVILVLFYSDKNKGCCQRDCPSFTSSVTTLYLGLHAEMDEGTHPVESYSFKLSFFFYFPVLSVPSSHFLHSHMNIHADTGWKVGGWDMRTYGISRSLQENMTGAITLIHRYSEGNAAVELCFKAIMPKW